MSQDDKYDDHIKQLVDRFLAWPLPASVSADGCATNPNYPHQRSGTNLLTADEARQMLEFLIPRQPLSIEETQRLLGAEKPIPVSSIEDGLALYSERQAALRAAASSEGPLIAAAKQIMGRRCSHPSPIGDSACDCCAHHWLTLQAAVGPEGWERVAPASASVDTDAKDAARYRWLRDASVPPHNFYLSVPDEFKDERYKPQQVDAAIDAAIGARSEGRGASG